ncbi:hypothetical protein VM98_28315 [Streptomyces rubellomurinus subsp. indigoferus]|nr:hypothetical protein VM98_28315 [Streptomyces rubellomurinus subsp. indigoferus]
MDSSTVRAELPIQLRRRSLAPSPGGTTMTWLRVLTALGILAGAAGALLVFAHCTSPTRHAPRARRTPYARRTPDTPRTPHTPRADRDAVGLRTDAEGSGLFPRTGGED